MNFVRDRDGLKRVAVFTGQNPQSRGLLPWLEFPNG